MSKITQIGCGIMGSRLAEAFIREGHDLTIVDINKEAVQWLLDKGAGYASELNDALDAELIFINLPNNEIAKKIIASIPDEGLSGIDVINSTTTIPAEEKEFDALIQAKGGRYLDCKIECYPPEAGTEHGYLVYSGDKDVFDKHYNALTALSPEPDFVGEGVAAASVLDMGAVLDLQFAVFYSLLEGVALAMKNDCSLEAFFAMAKGSTDGMVEIFERQMTDAFKDGIPSEYEKAKEASLDIEYHALDRVVAAVEGSGINASFSRHMLEMMKKVVEGGDGDKDMVVLMKNLLSN